MDFLSGRFWGFSVAVYPTRSISSLLYTLGSSILPSLKDCERNLVPGKDKCIESRKGGKGVWCLIRSISTGLLLDLL